MTNSVQLIALNKLEVGARNVRKTGARDGIDDLVASIAAHGLLQSLIVQRCKGGKFAVIAGGRRLRALKAMAKSGAISRTFAVPCRLIGADDNAIELSLAENIVRAPMLPADQFEAFCAIIDQGKCVADVAAHFNVSDDLVHKRLKLGRLSSVVLNAYREEQIDLEQAEAFAVSDDTAEQDRVFEELSPHGLHPRRIRAALTHGEVPSSDRRVAFVGEEAYVAAGGGVRRDLFGEDRFYVQDEGLLEWLVVEKLAALANQIRAEGWQWVTVDLEADYSTFASFVRKYPRHEKLCSKAEKQLTRLGRQYDDLAAKIDDDADNGQAKAKLDAIQQQIDALQPAEIWPAKTLASCGVILTLDHDGSARIEKGLMRQADVRKKPKPGKADEQAPSPYPANLVESLTAHKTAAIQAELLRQPGIALASLVHALVLKLCYHTREHESCLGLSATAARLPIDDQSSAALMALMRCREDWSVRLPNDESDLWRWCLDQPSETHIELLAYLAACTVSAVQHKRDGGDALRLRHANALARALNLDMTNWYVPTAEDFFSRLGRKAILSVIDEATGSHGPALEKLGKQELARRAAQLLKSTGWLPALLRPQTGPDVPPLTRAAG